MKKSIRNGTAQRVRAARRLRTAPRPGTAQVLQTMPAKGRARLFRARRALRAQRGQSNRGAPQRQRVFFHPNQRFAPGVGLQQFDPVGRPATLAGSTAHFHVYYADILGQAGEKVAQAVLKKCEADYQTLSGYFGIQQSVQFNVIIGPLSKTMDGTGGAYHHTCLATDLYCDVQLTPTVNSDVSSALVVAEEVEVFQAAQNGGWRCGKSNGEGLSRVLAEELYPNVLEKLGYDSASSWLNSRRPNLVGRTLPSDTNGVANGCAVLFLNYLHTQLGFGWDKICQAAAPTLARTYAQLTGKKAPFRDFAALLERKFPSGQQVNLGMDNPFPINSPSATEGGGSKPGSSHKPK